MNKFIQAYNTKFSLCPCPKNLSQNSSNNITNYLHYPKFYKPPTLSKLHHDQKKKKKEKYNTSKMLQNQHYNMINHTMPQIPTRSHNKMTMSHHQTFNEAWSNTFPNKKNQRKTHLDLHVRIWSMGLGVLKDPLLIIPFKWWMIYLAMRSEKRGSIGRKWHFDAMKRWVWKWVSPKMGV